MPSSQLTRGVRPFMFTPRTPRKPIRRIAARRPAPARRANERALSVRRNANPASRQPIRIAANRPSEAGARILDQNRRQPWVAISVMLMV